MQQRIQEPGSVEVEYRCDVCPNGCRLFDGMTAPKIKLMFHQHACHHFPSLTTNFIRVA